MSYEFSFNNYIYGTFSSPGVEPSTIALVAWVKLSASDWASTGTPQSIVYCMEARTSYNYHQGLNVNMESTANRIGAWSNLAGSSIRAQYTYTDTGQYDDKWVPIIANFDGDGSGDCTWRTATIQSTTYGSSPQTTSRDFTTHVLNDILIGTRNSGNSPCKGKIAQVAVFNRKLTDAEINNLTDGTDGTGWTGPAPNTIASSACIGYWPLTSSETTFTDESGNGGPTLVKQNSPTFSSDNPSISSGASGSVSNIPLVDHDNVALSSLTNLRWSWFDEPDPKDFTAPTDQGTTESTDSSGNISISIPSSTLTSGQTGFLVLRDNTNSYVGGYRLNVD